MELNSFVSFEDVLFKKFKDFGDRTYSQIYLCRNWPFAKKRQYVGDWSDLEQSLLCGLLEWHRELGKPDRVLEGALLGKLEEIFEAEVEANSRKERLGEPVVDPEGNWQHWNPTEPDDLTDERAKSLSTVIEGIGKLVGEVGAYVVKARILHGLSWEKISYRLNHVHPRKGEPEDYHSRRLEGFYLQGATVLSPQEVEALFTTSVEMLRARASDGSWHGWEKFLKPKKESAE